MRLLTDISRKYQFAIWHRFARLFGETRAGDLRSKPDPLELAVACAIIGEASGETVEVTHDERASVLVEMAANEDCLRILRNGRAKRLLWENT